MSNARLRTGLATAGALLSAGLWAGLAWAQAAPGSTAQGQAVVSFTFDNPGLELPHWTMTVHEDGSGLYRAGPGTAALPITGAATGTGSTAAQPANEAPPPMERAFTLGEPLRKQLFTVARKNHLFASECEPKRQKVAFTGTKTLAYSGPGGSGSCTFNYAHDSGVQQVSGQLIAVANTLQEGRRLELLLVHDRLGLEAAMDVLVSEQADGRALELGNIAPVLHAIATDPDVLNHSRSRAELLLKGGDPSSRTH